MTLCRLCQEPITFDKSFVSDRTGKKIPLDTDTGEPHNCRVRNERRNNNIDNNKCIIINTYNKYVECINCHALIYFHAKHKIQTGLWVPFDKKTGGPHQCG